MLDSVAWSFRGAAAIAISDGGRVSSGPTASSGPRRCAARLEPTPRSRLNTRTQHMHTHARTRARARSRMLLLARPLAHVLTLANSRVFAGSWGPRAVLNPIVESSLFWTSISRAADGAATSDEGRAAAAAAAGGACWHMQHGESGGGWEDGRGRVTGSLLGLCPALMPSALFAMYFGLLVLLVGTLVNVCKLSPSSRVRHLYRETNLTKRLVQLGGAQASGRRRCPTLDNSVRRGNRVNTYLDGETTTGRHARAHLVGFGSSRAL